MSESHTVIPYARSRSVMPAATMAAQAGLSILGGEQFPVPLGDDFDCTIGHFDGALIINRVRRHWYPGGPSFCVGQGILRGSLVIQVRKQRKINQSQRSVVAGGQIT